MTKYEANYWHKWLRNSIELMRILAMNDRLSRACDKCMICVKEMRNISAISKEWSENRQKAFDNLFKCFNRNMSVIRHYLSDDMIAYLKANDFDWRADFKYLQGMVDLADKATGRAGE